MWSHAVPYIGTINRLSTSILRGVGNAFGCGAGGWNGDVWKMGVCFNTGSFSKDLSTHAIYAGIETEKLNDNCFKAIAMKGAGTVLCVGNGGCEFSMKNEDGTPDKSANPKNNSCQQNVLKLAKNSIEYLMSI